MLAEKKLHSVCIEKKITTQEMKGQFCFLSLFPICGLFIIIIIVFLLIINFHDYQNIITIIIINIIIIIITINIINIIFSIISRSRLSGIITNTIIIQGYGPSYKPYRLRNIPDKSQAIQIGAVSMQVRLSNTTWGLGALRKGGGGGGIH